MTNDEVDGGSSSLDEDTARDRVQTLVRKKKESVAAVQGHSSGPSSKLVVAALKRRGMIDDENRLG